MSDLDKLIEAVERGDYERLSGTPRYYDFGQDTAGILPGSRFERMSVYLGGKDVALERLRRPTAPASDGQEGER